uniref:Uncharacterized protein n=1 Tax=Anabas testudineus TaxID=64144 RepID=A0A3Q1HSM3_ANATE
MAEHHAVSDGKHKASANAGSSVHGNSRPGTVGGGGGKGGLSGGLTQPAGWQSLLSFSILFLACLAGFSSRLFAVIRFESIIHEFDPWMFLIGFLSHILAGHSCGLLGGSVVFMCTLYGGY